MTVSREPKQNNPYLPDRVRRVAWSGVVAVAGLAFVCNFGTLAVPMFNMQVFNRVFPTRDLSTMGTLAVGLLIALVVYNILETLRGVALETVAARVAQALSLPLVQAAALSPRADITVAVGLADLETIRNFIASRNCMAPFDLAWSPVLLVALLLMHWTLAALGIVCMLVLTVLNVLGDIISRQAMHAANEASTDALRDAAESVNAAEAVIALGMLATVRQRWHSAQEHASFLVHRALTRARAVSAITSALRAGMTGAVVALGLTLTLKGESSAGSMVAANLVLARLLIPFGSLAATRRQWIEAAAAWRRVRITLTTTTPSRYAAALPPPKPRLVVENLSYLPTGGDRVLLRNVSVTVESGDAVAIIGPSSAGKSTILRLMAGIVAPSTGGIFLDGTSTFLWEREDFAHHVGYVPQRPTLLDETVADNIARMQTPDLSRVIAISKRVGIHRSIAALPQGYATKLGGHALSGGQRQRLALARALYTSPKLVLLDEPSAFLDVDGEADLVRLLRDMRADGITVVMVTHRPSLLSTVDKVLVMKEGAVVQFGPVSEIGAQLTKERSIRLIKADDDRVSI